MFDEKPSYVPADVLCLTDCSRRIGSLAGSQQPGSVFSERPADDELSSIDVRRGSVLILDDDAGNLAFLNRLLRREGYTRVRAMTSAREAIASLRGQTADLLMLDLHMPDMDGFAVLNELRGIPGADLMSVLVLTGDTASDVRHRALSFGAHDFLTKPIDCAEAVLRIHNLLLMRLLLTALKHQNDALEERVRERTEDLEQAQVEILGRLALIAEYHDEGTAEHTRRVASLSGAIARAMGLDQKTASLISRASLLHDVGKVAVPADILHEPGPLSDEQWKIVRRHCHEGARILSGSRFRVLRQAEEIAHTHHERWDGTGYPNGLAADAIPLAGRIVAAADVCDALMSERPYKSAWSMASVRNELRRIRGSHLDPATVDALERLLENDLAWTIGATTEQHEVDIF
jgi:putative two-component system response regulator